LLQTQPENVISEATTLPIVPHPLPLYREKISSFQLIEVVQS